jgi:hypothetical protein
MLVEVELRKINKTWDQFLGENAFIDQIPVVVEEGHFGKMTRKFGKNNLGKRQKGKGSLWQMKRGKWTWESDKKRKEYMC